MGDDPLKNDLEYFIKLVGDLVKENKSGRIHSHMFSKIYNEVVKLKKSRTMNALPPRILLNACRNLASNFLNVETDVNNTQHNSRDQVLDFRIASLTILLILTSPELDKCVYSEDVIDRVVTFILKQTFSICKEGSKAKKNEEIKKVEFLESAVNLLTELVMTHLLTDFELLQVICVGHRAAQYGRNTLKFNGIRLLSVVSSIYENKQLFILNEIQDLILNCCYHEEPPVFPIHGSSKGLRVYSATVMTLLQSCAILPGVKLFNSSRRSLRITEKVESTDLEYKDSFICKRYKNVLLYSQHVTYEFLRNCVNQNGSRIIHYQKAMICFIHDLLNVMMQPEWPASHILLFDLAKHLVKVLQNKSVDAKTQLTCMSWLGEIMIKVMECVRLSQNNNEKLNQIIVNAQHQIVKCEDDGDSTYVNEESKLQDLQSILLTCVIEKIKENKLGASIENFYHTMWYGDIIRPQNVITLESLISENNKENVPPSKIKKKTSKKIKKMDHRKIPKREKKEYLIQLQKKTSSIVKSFHRFDGVSLVLNHSDIQLIISFFIRNGDFMESFDIFLNCIINMLKCEQFCLRAKAMQCLKSFMETDMALSKKPVIELVMKTFINDTCVSVREISVELIGKCISHIPDKCETYYPLILPHLWDKGVSVRKRVLKVLKDLTMLCPNFSKLSEVHLKILERIKDSEMKSVVIETLKSKWFTPLNSADLMIDQIKDLHKLMESSGTHVFNCLKILIAECFDSKETVKNCKQFVKCLVHYILEHEVNNSIHELCDCLKLLNVIAQVTPRMVVTYISALHSHLSLCNQTNENIILPFTGILKCTIPFLENPPETFIVKLEEELLKLLFVHKQCVVESVVPCLIVLVKELTHNDKLIYDSYNTFFGAVKKFAQNEFTLSNKELSPESYIQRCLLTMGLVLKYYDFSSHLAQEYFKKETIDDTFDTFILLLEHPNSVIQWYALKALGEMCCQHYHYLLNNDLKVFYCNILSSRNTFIEMKHQVLTNIRKFLQENPLQVVKQDELKGREKKDTFQDQISQQEDESSNIILIVLQYLKEVLNCCIIQDRKVRWVAATILNNIIQCGFIPPQKIVSHLMALTTDCDTLLSQDELNILKQFDQSHPGIFDCCVKFGINLSYELQIHISKTELIRGYNDEEAPSHALLTPLYQIVQINKSRRRNFLHNIMKQFEETEMDINKMLYLSENLAYLPYEHEDELLFIIQFIDMIPATTGYDHVKKFRQQLLPDESRNKTPLENDDEHSGTEDNKNLQNILDQLPLDTSTLQETVFSFQSCLLLLKVGQYLKQTYGITDSMVVLYLSEQAKLPQKLSIDRRSKLLSQSYLQVLLNMKAKKKLSNDQLIHQYLELKNLVFSKEDHYSKKRKMNNANVGTQRKNKKNRSRK